MTTPLLLLVQHALPLHIQATPHVAQLVNDFILPSTIDAAVYNDLQRVLNVFDGFCPYTVGAMDGAAANGRLDIVQRLHDERKEGCSAAAFIGAAASNIQEALAAAAGNGHVPVVRVLLKDAGLFANAALERALVGGHIGVFEILLKGLSEWCLGK